MIKNTANAAKMAITCAALGLSACTISDHGVAADNAAPFEQRQVETLGETIAREQQGEHGCLVAGNLNKGGDCKKLREIVLPPPPLSDPKR